MTSMPPPSSRHIGLAGGTLHVADAITEPVFNELGPATATLARQGLPQTVLALDHAAHAPRLASFDDAVRLVLVPLPRPHWRRWLALREAVRRELQSHAPQSLHFHHPWAWLCCLGLRPLPPQVVVAPPVQGALGEALFAQVPQPARRALVVAGCHEQNRKAVELFCRAAVVFGAAELDVAFNWIGPVSTADAQRLQAAGIGCLGPAEAADEAAVAARLRPAWVFLAGGGERGFALRLAQAMACGLPCLAADLPAHRALIDDGVNGLLYRSEEEALQLMGQLLDDAALRDTLGRAARAAARSRCTPQRVGEELPVLYRASGGALAGSGGGTPSPAGEVQGA